MYRNSKKLLRKKKQNNRITFSFKQNSVPTIEEASCAAVISGSQGASPVYVFIGLCFYSFICLFIYSAVLLRERIGFT